MPNPRLISEAGEPTVELLGKLQRGRGVYLSNIPWFCEKYGLNPEEFKDVQGVYLIGSHAQERGWHDDTSDIDFKILNPSATPSDLHRYKREVLDRLLHEGEKRRWVDLFFARADYQITMPRFDLTSYWNKMSG